MIRTWLIAAVVSAAGWALIIWAAFTAWHTFGL